MAKNPLDSTELGIRIAKIKQKILLLPLYDLMNQINHWETVTPLLDPTLYVKHRDTMDTFAKTVRILLRTKQQLLETLIKESVN